MKTIYCFSQSVRGNPQSEPSFVLLFTAFPVYFYLEVFTYLDCIFVGCKQQTKLEDTQYFHSSQPPKILQVQCAKHLHQTCALFITEAHLNRPFLNSLLPLFQNESTCKSFHIKIILICMKMDVLVKHIFKCIILCKALF